MTHLTQQEKHALIFTNVTRYTKIRNKSGLPTSAIQHQVRDWVFLDGKVDFQILVNLVSVVSVDYYAVVTS